MALVLAGVARRTGSATSHRSALMMVLLASALHATGLLFATMLRNVLETSLVVAIGATVFVLSVSRESRTARRSAAVPPATLESPVA